VSNPHEDVFVHFYEGEHEEDHGKIVKEWTDYQKLFRESKPEVHI